jgi:ElaB/YqjD/DUF883 family membrane-anchored ribosome-binding protein
LENLFETFIVALMNTDIIKERTEDFQEQAEEAVRSFRDKADGWREAATEGAVNFAKSTDTYFRENPWTMMGVVAAVAFTLGLVVGSRRDWLRW